MSPRSGIAVFRCKARVSALARGFLFFACPLRRLRRERQAGPKGEHRRCESRKVGKRKHSPSSRPALRAGFAGLAEVFRRAVHGPSKNARHPAVRPAGLIRETCRFEGRSRSKPVTRVRAKRAHGLSVAGRIKNPGCGLRPYPGDLLLCRSNVVTADNVERAPRMKSKTEVARQ